MFYREFQFARNFQTRSENMCAAIVHERIKYAYENTVAGGGGFNSFRNATDSVRDGVDSV